MKAFPTTFGQGDVGGLAVDAQGNVVITGTISGSTDFDGTVIDPYGYDSVYVAKLAADGALLWADIVFLDDTHEVARPAIDPDGNIVLLGTNTCVTCAPARTQLWIRTFGPDGVVLWTRAFNELDGAGSYTLGGVAADPFGNLIITAGFQGTATLGSWTFTSEGGNNVLVLKLDSQGNGVWSRKLGGAPVTSSDIVADAVGSIIMTGNFTGTVSLGASGPDITSGAAGDIFVVKLSSANALSWSRVFGDDEFQRGGRLAMGPDDALSLTGGVVGSVDFGGGPLVARSESVALWKLSPEGAHLWSRLLGGQLASVVISADADGTLLLGSAAVGDVDLGAGLLASAGDSDVLVGSFAR